MPGRFAVTLLLLSHFLLLGAQQTIGIFLNTPESYDGYTLIAPTNYNKAYLIDNCGQLVNEWSSNFNPGMSTYLLENGILLKTARIGGQFNTGGLGGRVEMLDWESNIVWSYNFSTPTYQHHHDIEYLPNGNILIIAYDLITQNEAIEMGRDPSNVSFFGLYSEQIFEVQPIGQNDAAIVWEWHLKDHFIQDFDSTKSNYGVVSEHPELFNINHPEIGGGPSGNADFVHLNSIDYHEEFDQILIGSRVTSEIYVIDHSTSLEEASTHEGGKYGQGGDFLYRWGNPRIYNSGSESDQQLFGQHDASWIPHGKPGEGNILVFNNGGGRPGGSASSVDVIIPPADENGNYELSHGNAFGPSGIQRVYPDALANSFYETNVSGAQRLPNGNTLICAGRDNRIFEVDEQGDIVWDYWVPVGGGGPISQGNIANGNLFRAYRYPADFPAFIEQDMTPGEVIELNPIDTDCELYPMSTALGEEGSFQSFTVYPNPVDDLLFLRGQVESDLHYSIFDMNGIRVKNGILDINRIEVGELVPGIHILKLDGQSPIKFVKS